MAGSKRADVDPLAWADGALDLGALYPEALLACELDETTWQTFVRRANAAALRTFGLPEHELVGRPARDLLALPSVFEHEAARRRFHERLRTARRLELSPVPIKVADGGSRPMRVRLWWPDPDRLLTLIVVEPLTDASHDVIGVEVHTELVEVAQVMSHHINNALAVAYLELESMRGELAASAPALEQHLGPTFDEIGRQIQTSGRVLSGFAHAIVSRPEVERRADLWPIVARSIERLGRGGVTLHDREGSDAPIWVLGGDPTVETIVEAVLALVVQSLDGASGELGVTVATRGGIAHLEITGDAPLSGSLRRQLLDPATTAIPVSEVSVRFFAASRLVAALGGRLEVIGSLEEARGVRVAFRRPDAAAGPGNDTPDPAGRPPRVLVVSGDAMILELVSQAVSACRIDVARSAAEGMRRAIRGDYDLVVYDAAAVEIPARQFAQQLDWGLPGRSRRLVHVVRGGDTPEIVGPMVRIPCPPAELEAEILEHVRRASASPPAA